VYEKKTKNNSINLIIIGKKTKKLIDSKPRATTNFFKVFLNELFGRSCFLNLKKAKKKENIFVYFKY